MSQSHPFAQYLTMVVMHFLAPVVSRSPIRNRMGKAKMILATNVASTKKVKGICKMIRFMRVYTDIPGNHGRATASRNGQGIEIRMTTKATSVYQNNFLYLEASAMFRFVAA